MKLQPDANQAAYVITGHQADQIEINGQPWSTSVCVGHATAPQPWGQRGFDALTRDDVDALLQLDAAVLLIGTGARQRFLHPSLLQGLIAAGIGIEVMTTPAACRTYNVLVGEGRRAAAALLLDAGG